MNADLKRLDIERTAEVMQRSQEWKNDHAATYRVIIIDLVNRLRARYLHLGSGVPWGPNLPILWRPGGYVWRDCPRSIRWCLLQHIHPERISLLSGVMKATALPAASSRACVRPRDRPQPVFARQGTQPCPDHLA